MSGEGTELPIAHIVQVSELVSPIASLCRPFSQAVHALDPMALLQVPAWQAVQFHCPLCE